MRPPEPGHRQRLSKRGIIVVSICGTAFFLVFLRLFEVMLLNHHTYQRLASEQYTKVREIVVNRGKIFDRRGRVLALNTDAVSVYYRPGLESPPQEALEKLSNLLGLPERRLREKFDSRRRFLWLARKIDADRSKEFERIPLKGLGLLRDTRRVYPKGKIGAHLLGFVDIDNRGLEGVERVYDDLLSREAPKVTLRTDALGNLLYSGVETETEGNGIVLTIDEAVQVIVESELDRAVKKWSPRAASVVVMDPYTGEVLALANRPTFDPNSPGRYRASYRRNRAVTDLYEPGSTFKIVMAAAALETGTATLATRLDCSEGYVDVAGKRIWDTRKHGVLTLKEVIQKSSNVGAVKIAMKIGPEVFYRYVKAFGFGEKTGIDLVGESTGVVKPLSAFSGTTLAAMAIGYEVMVTPIQVLRAYSAVANGGYLVRPHLLKAIVTPEGHILYPKEYPKERIISSRTAYMLKEALKAVVTEEGTGHHATIEGNTVAGKTGTTRMVDPATGRYSKDHYVSSFVGFVPADRPAMAVVVVFWDPKGAYYGGEVAAPVFRTIASRILSYMMVPREDLSPGHILVSDRQRYQERTPRNEVN